MCLIRLSIFYNAGQGYTHIKMILLNFFGSYVFLITSVQGSLQLVAINPIN